MGLSGKVLEFQWLKAQGKILKKYKYEKYGYIFQKVKKSTK